MQDAMSFFLSGRSDDYVDLDQDGVIHAIRCEANVKMRTLAEAAHILIDDDTFQHHVGKDFSDLTMIAAQCPGADGRSDMLIMLTEKIERTQQMWWAAEWEFTTGLKKEMKAKWDELHGKRKGEFSEKFDQGEFRRAAKAFGFAVATGTDWVATSAAAYPPITPTKPKVKDRSRSPPSRAPTRDEGLDFSDTLDPNPFSDDDTQKTLPLRGPRESDEDSGN